MRKKIKSFLFENKSTRQRVAKNTFWLFIGETASRILKIIIVVYAARELGAEGWGVFSYGITVAGFLTIFSDMGLNSLIIKEAVQNPEVREKYISTTLFIKIALLIFSALLIIFAAPYFTKIDAVKPLLPIVALLLVLDSLREFGLSVNRVSEKMELEAAIKIFTNVAIVGFGIGALIISKTPMSLAVGYSIGSAAGLVATVVTLRKRIIKPFRNFSTKLVMPIFSSAWPLAVSGVLGGIMISMDIFMLGWLKSAGDVGLYSAAQRPVQFFYLIPGILSASAFPVMARFVREKNASKLRELLEKTIGVTLLIGIPIVIGGIILGEDLITLVFGNEYLQSVSAFKILLLSILIIFPANLIVNAVFSYGKQKVFANFMAAGAVGNIALNIVLIPKYGIEGASIATVLSQGITNFLIWQKMKKINYFTIFGRIKKVVLAGIIMSTITIGFVALGVNVIMNIILSGAVYFLALKLLNEPLIGEIWDILKQKN